MPSAGSSNFFVVVGGDDDLEGVPGRRRGVDDDAADRALLRRLQVLVIPAAVPEPRLAGEERRVARRVVVHDDDDLPAHVDVLVIVPIEFRRDDAVADEDERSAGQLHLRLRLARHHDEVFGDAQRQRGPLAVRDDRLGQLRGHRDQRHALEEGAVVAARLEPGGGKLGGQVVHGQLIATRPRSPSFEQIAGEKTRRRCDRGTGDASGERHLLGGEAGSATGRAGRSRRRRRGRRRARRHGRLHGRSLRSAGDGEDRGGQRRDEGDGCAHFETQEKSISAREWSTFFLSPLFRWGASSPS